MPFLRKESFKKASKCKTYLQVTLERIKVVRNKKQIVAKQWRDDIAKLLLLGQDESALTRVDHAVKEENLLAAYNILEQYCTLLIGRIHTIEAQKQCPSDLVEAVSCLIYATPRCGDLVELPKLRQLFAENYGTDFVSTALELRPGCAVNTLIIQKLSSQPTNRETKLKVLKDIARDYNISWDSSKVVSHGSKKTEHLSDGSSQSTSASQVDSKSTSQAPARSTTSSAAEHPVASLSNASEINSSRSSHKREPLPRDDSLSQTPRSAKGSQVDSKSTWQQPAGSATSSAADHSVASLSNASEINYSRSSHQREPLPRDDSLSQTPQSAKASQLDSKSSSQQPVRSAISSAADHSVARVSSASETNSSGSSHQRGPLPRDEALSETPHLAKVGRPGAYSNTDGDQSQSGPSRKDSNARFPEREIPDQVHPERDQYAMSKAHGNVADALGQSQLYSVSKGREVDERLSVDEVTERGRGHLRQKTEVVKVRQNTLKDTHLEDDPPLASAKDNVITSGLKMHGRTTLQDSAQVKESQIHDRATAKKHSDGLELACTDTVEKSNGTITSEPQLNQADSVASPQYDKYDSVGSNDDALFHSNERGAVRKTKGLSIQGRGEQTVSMPSFDVSDGDDSSDAQAPSISGLRGRTKDRNFQSGKSKKFSTSPDPYQEDLSHLHEFSGVDSSKSDESFFRKGRASPAEEDYEQPKPRRTGGQMEGYLKINQAHKQIEQDDLESLQGDDYVDAPNSYIERHLGKKNSSFSRKHRSENDEETWQLNLKSTTRRQRNKEVDDYENSDRLFSQKSSGNFNRRFSRKQGLEDDEDAYALNLHSKLRHRNYEIDDQDTHALNLNLKSRHRNYEIDEDDAYALNMNSKLRNRNCEIDDEDTYALNLTSKLRHRNYEIADEHSQKSSVRKNSSFSRKQEFDYDEDSCDDGSTNKLKSRQRNQETVDDYMETVRQKSSVRRNSGVSRKQWFQDAEDSALYDGSSINSKTRQRNEDILDGMETGIPFSQKTSRSRNQGYRNDEWNDVSSLSVKLRQRNEQNIDDYEEYTADPFSQKASERKNSSFIKKQSRRNAENASYLQSKLRGRREEDGIDYPESDNHGEMIGVRSSSSEARTGFPKQRTFDDGRERLHDLKLRSSWRDDQSSEVDDLPESLDLSSRTSSRASSRSPPPRSHNHSRQPDEDVSISLRGRVFGAQKADPSIGGGYTGRISQKPGQNSAFGVSDRYAEYDDLPPKVVNRVRVRNTEEHDQEWNLKSQSGMSPAPRSRWQSTAKQINDANPRAGRFAPGQDAEHIQEPASTNLKGRTVYAESRRTRRPSARKTQEDEPHSPPVMASQYRSRGSTPPLTDADENYSWARRRGASSYEREDDDDEPARPLPYEAPAYSTSKRGNSAAYAYSVRQKSPLSSALMDPSDSAFSPRLDRKLRNR